jgi:glycosyltransferase involved in cell wall biosynthesis
MSQNRSPNSDRLAALEARISALEESNRALRLMLDQQYRPSSWTSHIKNSFYSRIQLKVESLRDKIRPKIGRFHQYPPRVLRVPTAYEKSSLEKRPPTIAIVTPSYNQAKFIAATVDSVLSQNYPALRYHVQDAASSDGTVDLLKSYDGKISWSSIRDKGQAHALNCGFRSCDGEIMAYLNSDDLFLPGALAYVAEAFAADPNLDVVYGHRICIDEEGMEIGRWLLPKHDRTAIQWFDFIPQETMFWRRRVWEALDGFDESFDYALDWDFILRAHAKNMKFMRLPRFLGAFRVHSQQKTTRMFDVGEQESRRLRMIHLGFEPDGEAINDAVAGYLRRHVLYHRLYKLKVINC